MRGLHRRLLVPLLALGTALSAPPGASADTYPRQPGVDALHYTFRLTLADNSDDITGETTIDLRLLKAGLTEVALDLASAANGKGMTVSTITSAAPGEAPTNDKGAPLRFVHDANRLRITLPAPSQADARVRLTVQYHGVPAAGLRIGTNKYGERTFFGLNWPDKAREWLPTIDHPYDKATSEFLVSAPAHYQIVSNGLLIEERDLDNGQRLTHWKQSVPIATWLTTIGVARFASHHAGAVNAGTANGVPLQTWVFVKDRDAGLRDFERISRQVLAFFGEQIGPYPYEKLANVEAAGLGGGTEHASAIFYGEKSVTGAGRIDNLVTHEIAHQWFGNAVTERDWDDVWLSEGFATYFTLLFVEHAQGRDAFVAGLTRSRDQVLAFEKKTPDYRIVHDNISDMRRVLSGQIYQKGGWTLHMLRGLVGTETFWTGIRDYYRRYRDANASTSEFRRVMEETSGRDLAWFFPQWLERGDTPKLQGRWRYDAAAKQIQIDLEQTQPGAPFRLPLDIGITMEEAGGTTPRRVERVEKIELRERRQSFTIGADAAPVQVTLDPNTFTLMEATFTKQ